MSASERAARAWLTEARASVGMFDSDAQRVERLVPSLATLLATSAFAARAEARRETWLEAVRMERQHTTLWDFAAALRTKAGEEKP